MTTDHSRSEAARVGGKGTELARAGARLLPAGGVGTPCFLAGLVRQGIGPQLDVNDARPTALTTFHQPGCPITARRPQPATFPAGIGIIDASIETFGVKAQRIRHPQYDHLPILEGDQAIIEVARRHWHVLTEAKGVVLIDPRIVAGLGAVLADTEETGTRILVERPALLAMITHCAWSVQRPVALAAVKATDMSTSQRHPNNALLVDVTTARCEAGSGNVVDFGQRGRGRVGPGVEPQHGTAAGEHANRIPDGAVDRAWHHRIGARAGRDAHVLGRVDGLARLGVVVAFAVTVAVEHKGGPALRRRRVTGFIKPLAVEPACDLPATAGPDRVVAIVTELQVVRSEAGIDKAVFHRLGLENGELTHILLDWEQLGRRMAGTLLAKVGIVGTADCRRQPDAALLVEHRVVIVHLRVPQLLLTPIGRGLQRLFDCGVSRSQR